MVLIYFDSSPILSLSKPAKKSVRVRKREASYKCFIVRGQTFFFIEFRLNGNLNIIHHLKQDTIRFKYGLFRCPTSIIRNYRGSKCRDRFIFFHSYYRCRYNRSRCGGCFCWTACWHLLRRKIGVVLHTRSIIMSLFYGFIYRSYITFILIFYWLLLLLLLVCY